MLIPGERLVRDDHGNDGGDDRGRCGGVRDDGGIVDCGDIASRDHVGIGDRDCCRRCDRVPNGDRGG